MMNTRIIELLQQPKLITPKDLSLLETQIQQQPYIQNIRALYLYGVHLHQPQRYKEILTTTAAYTTDKKILYQFINQKSHPEITVSSSPVASVSPIEPKKVDEKSIKPGDSEKDKNIVSPAIEAATTEAEKEEIVEDSQPKISDEVVTTPQSEITPNFKVESLEDANDEPKANLPKELETETNVETATEPKVEVIEESVEKVSTEEDLNFSKDTVIESDTIEDNKTEIDKELSFDAIDDFLPEVKFSVPKNHNTFLNPPTFEKPKTQEAILPTIVSEISNEKIEDDIIDEYKSATVSFQETADFDSFNQEKFLVEETVILSDDNLQETSVITEKSIVEETWQPMQVDSHTPDGLIGKSNVVSIPETVTLAEDISKIKGNIIESEILVQEPEANFENNNTEESRPIINVSFFSDALSIVTDKKEDAIEPAKSNAEEPQVVVKSNVGTFINTWQSWLKIDREDEVVVKQELTKDKVIEQFIENQPKISQLKDEVSFVVKEKKEDISHLMTETFANLYLEQKLYTKAIKAFEILIAKHPEKADYFKSRIEDIKDIRKPF